MMLEIILTVTFLVFLLIAVFRFYPRSSKSVSTIPGLSPSSKEDGNLGDAAKRGSLHEFLVDLHSRFGPISGFWWGQTYVVSIASPELMNQHSHVFDRPAALFKSFEVLIGPKCILYANGSDGRGRRKTYDPVLAHDKIDRYLGYFEQCVQRTETKWLSLGEDDHIALTEECSMYAIHCATLSILGGYYEDEKVFKEFKDYNMVMWNVMELGVIDPATAKEEKYVKQYEEALSFLHSSIKKAISYRKEHELHLQNNLIIDELIANCPDEATLVGDVLIFLIGGFHTSTNLMIWALYYLATHQDVQEKLYKEVKNVLGEHGSVNKDNFSEFQYLIQVIDETLRCSIIVTWAARFEDVDSELGGHKIPKNTPVIQALGVLSLDEKIWPSPKKFDPERFSPENRKKIPKNCFLPFGAGKRKCPGYRFAYWDAGVFLATIIRRFKVTMCSDQVVTPYYGVVTHPNEEIWIKVAKRE